MTNTEHVKVSVIMPVYNAEDYLRPAIDSVLDQTLKEIEIICVDDGSTDHSLEIIKEYRKNDARVRIITENNAGPSIARNKGLARARGEYIVFLDADDFSEITMLEELYELAKRDELDIAISKYDIYNDKRARFEPNIPSDHGEIFEGDAVVSKNDYPDYILQCTTAYVWNKMWRRAFLAEKELTFDPELRVFEDTYFVVTALSLADRVGKLQKVLTHHRVYSDQNKNKLFRKYYSQVPLLFAKIKEFLRGHGTYAPLWLSFLNLSTSRCYKVYNLLWRDAKEDFWTLLHDSFAEELGWKSAAPDEFESEEVRDFCANVILYSHKQYEKRQRRGLKVRIRSVGPSIKASYNRRKIRKMLAGIFKRKKKEDII